MMATEPMAGEMMNTATGPVNKPGDAVDLATKAGQPAGPMIEILGVSKVYGGRPAVDDMTLVVPRGELFAFLGPNGAGKTTTIKMLCGLLRPTTGSIRVGGFDLVHEGRQARATMSYVPDLPYLYDKLTGREFLQFVADMHAMEKDRAAERIAFVSKLFRLDNFLDNLTERYSHGMRQRTVFASALLHEPGLLIVDEPTVGLDPRSVRQLKDILREHADNGTTVFLSSHSLDVVEELADRIGIINKGKLIGVGKVADLKTQASHQGSLEEVFLRLTEEESTTETAMDASAGAKR
jgi:ABC-2 type transport system ATP-binding protein